MRLFLFFIPDCETDAQNGKGKTAHYSHHHRTILREIGSRRYD